jgi:hypothetical protein
MVYFERKMDSLDDCLFRHPVYADIQLDFAYSCVRPLELLPAMEEVFNRGDQMHQLRSA